MRPIPFRRGRLPRTKLTRGCRRSVRFIRDVLRSAMTSADEAEADMRRLHVTVAKVDGGPYLRRWRPKDRGRAHPIAKRMSHIHVTVAER